HARHLAKSVSSAQPSNRDGQSRKKITYFQVVTVAPYSSAMSAGIQPHLCCERSRRRNAVPTIRRSHRVQETSMRTNWLLIVPLVTFGYFCEAPAQVGDLAGVLPGDRWV